MNSHLNSARKSLKIGTRGSLLALAQANMVKAQLEAVAEDITVSLEIIQTSGDKNPDRKLAEIGGKGLFTKEIEEAMQDGRVDIAVHSMKDVETKLQRDLIIPCYLPREDPRDVLISREGKSLQELPKGARFGTCSLRRKAQVLSMRPDLEIVLFRGNVDTRLRKIEEGVAEATLLALAGLKRLGRAEAATEILEYDVMLPAVAQGAIGVQCRTEDHFVQALLARFHDRETGTCVDLERAFLKAVDGSCSTPVGALAQIQGMEIVFEGLVATEDGKELNRKTLKGPLADMQARVTALGEEMRDWLKVRQQ